MRTRNAWHHISLVALVSMGSWGCSLMSANPTGSGGAGGDTGSAGSTGSGGSSVCPPAMATPGATGAGGAPSTVMGPCDIYAADGGPCVAAHSTVRALYAAYNGPLYQVRKTDCTTKDIGVIAPGGLANSAEQDAFCGTEACTISLIYDQSPRGNHLAKGPPSMIKPTATNESNAKALPTMLGANKVYGVRIVPGGGYRNNAAVGTAEGDNPETEYMVVAGDFYNGGCCFDYGNMERNSRNNHEGTMEAVYFGTCTIWGTGAGAGPWVMGDLEDGLWAGNTSPYEPNMPVLNHKYVTGMVKGDVAGANHWTIKVGNAQTGPLATPFDGPRPSSRYNPMRKEGAIGLGTGGDGSSGAQGNFFEGVMTAHYSTNAADDAVQANIVSVYGQQ
jgi:non-reducing end alpha-L-arabinofuranosidase